MGYILNQLGNLAVDDTVKKYIYIAKPSYQDDLSEQITRNFFEIAKEIGDNAVILAGTHPNLWLDQVGTTYFGKDWPLYEDLMPALIITDSHPEEVTAESERIVIPLARIDDMYDKNWSRFFVLLTEYARGENTRLKDRLQSATDAFDKANKIISIKPSFLGISINFNEIISSIIEDAREAQKPPLVR